MSYSLNCEYSNGVELRFTVDHKTSLSPILYIKPIANYYPKIPISFSLHLPDLFFVDIWRAPDGSDFSVKTNYVDLERKYNYFSDGQDLDIVNDNILTNYPLQIYGRYRNIENRDQSARITCPKYIKIDDIEFKLINLRQYLELETPMLTDNELGYMETIIKYLVYGAFAFMYIEYHRHSTAIVVKEKK